MKAIMEAYRETLKSAAFEVKDCVQSRGNAAGVRSRWMHSVSAITLAQPDIGDFTIIVANRTLWQQMVDRCLSGSEAYRAAASAYDAQPELSPEAVINGASICKQYFQSLDDARRQFPYTEGGKCGDGDLYDMLDNVLCMVSKNFDAHFARAQKRKLNRRLGAYMQPVVWGAFAAVAALLDPHISPLGGVANRALDARAVEGAAAVGVVWLIFQVVALFSDHHATLTREKEQGELENALKTSTLGAGNDIARREERLLRIMEQINAQARMAMQEAWKHGELRRGPDDVRKWARLFDFISARLNRLHAYVRGSVPLVDICFRASSRQAERDNAFVALPDDFYGIPRVHLRRLCFALFGAATIAGGALFVAQHGLATLGQDFFGSVFVASGVAVLASGLMAFWRARRISRHLAAPLSPELIKGLSDNMVCRLQSGEAAHKTQALQRDMAALREELDLMEQDVRSGFFQAPRRRRPDGERDEDDREGV